MINRVRLHAGEDMKIPKNVKKQIFNIAFLVLLIGITLVVLIASNRELSFGNIFGFLKSCDPWWLIAALIAMFFSVAFEGISLHFILRGLGERPRLRSSMVYATADVYYSAITPSASGGQPASAFYMVKDGIGAGKASFALVYNLIAYTTAIIVLGVSALALRPELFTAIDHWYAHTLIILGFGLQSLLLAFFIACMFCGRAVLKCGNGLISLLVKLRIIKKKEKEEKWRKKLSDEVEKYRECRRAIREHPAMSFANFVFNLAQRVSAVLIAVFVCKAAAPEAQIIELFVFEAFVVIGYNSIPLPGGVGAFELLYLSIYCIAFEEAFVLASMMVTRAISYYLRMLLSGIYTLIYHIRLMRRIQKKNESGETYAEEQSSET